MDFHFQLLIGKLISYSSLTFDFAFDFGFVIALPGCLISRSSPYSISGFCFGFVFVFVFVFDLEGSISQP